MRPAAARAMVDLILAIDCMIAARSGIELTAAGCERTEHGAFLKNHFEATTYVESLGFVGERRDKPLGKNNNKIVSGRHSCGY